MQKSPSSHSAAIEQHAGAAVGTWPQVAELPHVSAVQRLASSHSMSLLQQPLMAVCEQAPLGSLQASVVQRLVSPQLGGEPGVHEPD